MNRNTRKVIYLLFLAVIFGAYYFYQKNESALESAEYTVIDVIDGDTVVIDDVKNSRVRYLGIDTPEIAHQDSPGDPMSEEAAEFNSSLVSEKRVILEFDEQMYDQYGRILAYVYVGDVFVNEELVKEGLATCMFLEPNIRYSEIINNAVIEAKNERKGIWGELKGLKPTKENDRYLVELDKVGRYEGKRVVVPGTIIGSRKTDNVIVLNMEDKLDIVIYPDCWENFQYFGIDPLGYYENRKVEVTGRVKMRRGKPGIVVDHPMVLRSLN